MSAKKSEIEKVLDEEKIKGINMYFSIVAKGYGMITELDRVCTILQALEWEIGNLHQLDEAKIISELCDIENSLHKVKKEIKAIVEEGE